MFLNGIDWYLENINRSICKVLHKARIICPIYSYVLFYNIEKSGLNAVTAYLLLYKLFHEKNTILLIDFFQFSYFYILTVYMNVSLKLEGVGWIP